MSQSTPSSRRPSLPRHAKAKISYAGQAGPEHRPSKRRRLAAPATASDGHAYVARLRLPDNLAGVQANPITPQHQDRGADPFGHLADDVSSPFCQWCERDHSEVVFLPASQLPPACMAHMLNRVCRQCVIHQCQASTRRGQLPFCGYCGLYWSFEITSLVLEPKEMMEYEKRLSHQAIERDPTFRWCAQDKCVSGQFFDAKLVADDPKVCCVACEGVNCFACRDIWHEGMTCEEYQDPVKREESIGEDLQRTLGTMRRAVTKKCPVCGTGVQKSDGCSHMICSYCNADFNWDTAPSV